MKIKRFLTSLLCCGLAIQSAGCVLGDGSNKKPEHPKYSILFVGNSMIFYNELPIMFKNIVKEEGYEIAVDSVTAPGYYLHQFLDPNDTYARTLAKKLETNHYDFVIVNDQSFNPLANSADFYDSVSRMKEKVESVGAKLVLYETFAYKDGHSKLSQTNNTQYSMTKKLIAEYESAGEFYELKVSPAGKAAWCAYQRNESLKLHDNDLLHPSPMGSYLVALCHVGTIYGYSPKLIKSNYIFNEEDATLLKEVADACIFGGYVVE